MLLIPDYSNTLNGAKEELLKQWAILDAFDMLAPSYDQPQTMSTFRRWHQEAGLADIDICLGYNGIEGRAKKPA
jgi:hypothetical protein